MTEATHSPGQRWSIHVQQLLSGAIRVRLAGMLDVRAASHVEQRLNQTARRARLQPVQLMLDLSDVLYLDEAGLDVLIRLQERLLAVGGDLEINDAPPVLRLLHEAHLNGQAWMRRGDGASRRF